MYEKILLSAGLSPNEAQIYELIMEFGEATASTINKKTSLKRGLTYKLLSHLIQKGLIAKIEKPGKIAIFCPEDPEKITEMLESQARKISSTIQSAEELMPQLISSYLKNKRKPGINYFEGVWGLEKVYADILKRKQDILLIRSVLDDNSEQFNSLVEKQIRLQVENNIHTKAITPLVEGTPSNTLSQDKKNLLERRILPKEKLSLPAQIIIYGNKVAITSFENTLFTTIIENEAISLSLRVIFQLLWELSLPLHNQNYQKIMRREII